MQKQNQDCIFCQIIAGKIPPGKGKVYDDENFIGILDLHPKVEGHTLIIAKNHYKTLLDIPTHLGNELQEAIKTISLNLIKEEKAAGVNVLSNIGETAGQVIHHCHIHIIPRKKDDGIQVLS